MIEDGNIDLDSIQAANQQPDDIAEINRRYQDSAQALALWTKKEKAKGHSTDSDVSIFNSHCLFETYITTHSPILLQQLETLDALLRPAIESTEDLIANLTPDSEKNMAEIATLSVVLATHQMHEQFAEALRRYLDRVQDNAIEALKKTASQILLKRINALPAAEGCVEAMSAFLEQEEIQGSARQADYQKALTTYRQGLIHVLETDEPTAAATTQTHTRPQLHILESPTDQPKPQEEPWRTHVREQFERRLKKFKLNLNTGDVHQIITSGIDLLSDLGSEYNAYQLMSTDNIQLMLEAAMRWSAAKTHASSLVWGVEASRKARKQTVSQRQMQSYEWMLEKLGPSGLAS